MSHNNLQIRSVRLLRAVPALVLATLLAACGGSADEASGVAEGSWDDVVEAATEEGEVTIYATQVPDNVENLADAFEEEYPGIKVNVVAVEDTELVPRVEAENRTGKGVGDLYVTANLPWITEQDDFFQEPIGPSFDDPAYDKATLVNDDGSFTVGSYVGAFAWNTDNVQETITDWSDIPDLDDVTVGVVKPDTASKVGFYMWLIENHGDDYLQRLADLDTRIYGRAPDTIAALTSGEIDVATFTPPLIGQVESGAPVEWAVGSRAWGVPFYGLLLNSSPHPNAAQLLADFLITPEGQEAFNHGGAAVLPDVPGTATTIDKVDALPLGELTADVQEQFNEKFDQVFTP